MEHIKSFDIAAEQQERHDWESILKETVGFAALSPKQQQMILVSLYANQRAMRATDAESAANIRETDFGEGILFPAGLSSNEAAQTQPYGISQKVIYDWYCHAAVESLETRDTTLRHDRDVPFPQKGEGHSLLSLDDMSAFIELEIMDKLLPIVLHVLSKAGTPYHTALVLGQSADGEWVVWEKRGQSLAFRLTTLKQVYCEYAEYIGEQIWVTRPLRPIPPM